MSTNANPYKSPLAVGSQWLPALRLRNDQEFGNGLTLSGFVAFLICATVFMSGFKSLRLQVGSLYLQPYLLLAAPSALAMLVLRGQRLPAAPTVFLALFVAIYGISLFSSAEVVAWMDPKEELVKVLASLVALLAVALLINSRFDFLLSSAGLCLSAALLASRGLQDEDPTAADKLIEGANKNSYSMYALPAVLLAFYLLARIDWKKVPLKWPIIIFSLLCNLIIGYVMLKGHNRSGYLGLAIVVLMLLVYILRSRTVGKATKGLLISLIAITSAVCVGLLVWLGASQAFENRFEQTVEGTQSDNLRQDLMLTSFKLGLQNPLLGVGPRMLPAELGRALPQYQEPFIDPHNVFGHIMGGSGLLCFLALMGAGLTLFFWRPKQLKGINDQKFLAARAVLRMMLLLWAVRGMFSREILYNPGFTAGLGLAIGLCLFEGRLAVKRQAESRVTGRFGLPLPLGQVAK